MKEIIAIVKASLPVVIGVAVGMLAFEQAKKMTTKTA